MGSVEIRLNLLQRAGAHHFSSITCDPEGSAGSGISGFSHNTEREVADVRVERFGEAWNTGNREA